MVREAPRLCLRSNGLDERGDEGTHRGHGIALGVGCDFLDDGGADDDAIDRAGDGERVDLHLAKAWSQGIASLCRNESGDERPEERKRLKNSPAIRDASTGYTGRMPKRTCNASVPYK